MYPRRRVNDSAQWFMNELTSRIVAESGIPTDRYHLGKIILQSFKDDPGFILQIDGATGKSETNGSVLERTVRCAIALKNIGLQRGDVITLMAPNHNDLAIPFYAAFYLGVTVSPIDRTLGINDLQNNFDVSRPKVVFCQRERSSDVQLALNGEQLDARIVIFDEFTEFLEAYGGKSPIEEFRPTDFDPEDTIAVLMSTSGTTGRPKGVPATHKNFAITGQYVWNRFYEFPYPTKMVLVTSPLQWLTVIGQFISSAIFRFTRLQTSQAPTQQHMYEIINKYRPSYMVVSPIYLTKLITPEGSEQCDFSCIETMYVGGCAFSPDLMHQMKKLAPNAEMLNGFGMSEVTTIVFSDDGSNLGSATVGKPIGCLQYRLIDIETKEDILEPYKNGELWVKGPGIVKSYYRNPEATAEAFTEDRWFKTGDMFYRDENYNFFFVDRTKLLLVYMHHQISPVELEATISQHPGVLEVVVTGVPDPGCGHLVVACVVRRPGQDVTADEIKQLVKDKLADSKQLRGVVIFLDSIPQTANAKVDRKKVKEIAMKTLIYS